MGGLGFSFPLGSLALIRGIRELRSQQVKTLTRRIISRTSQLVAAGKVVSLAAVFLMSHNVTSKKRLRGRLPLDTLKDYASVVVEPLGLGNP